MTEDGARAELTQLGQYYRVAPGDGGPEWFELTVAGMKAAIRCAASASAGGGADQELTVTRGALTKPVMRFAGGKVTWSAAELVPAAASAKVTPHNEPSRPGLYAVRLPRALSKRRFATCLALVQAEGTYDAGGAVWVIAQLPAAAGKDVRAVLAELGTLGAAIKRTGGLPS